MTKWSADDTVVATRERRVCAPAAVLSAWMCDVERLPLFGVNPCHAAASSDGSPLAAGSRERVEHRLPWKRETRWARLSIVRPYELAWAEVADEEREWFPHAQRFVVTPDGDDACRISNTLRGTFALPDARWWLLCWYRLLLPRILDLENRRIARAVERSLSSPNGDV